MDGFAERTGLTSAGPKQRYLWTDAFAVCNFLGLSAMTGERRHLDLALHLVDQVQHVLGRYRPDDPRSGWLSGLSEKAGESHPTLGGLRIGKRLPERGSDEAFDPELEWDRDGQYFHYLTKWMHALDQVSRFTRDPRYNLWARELADVAHTSFTRGSEGSRAPRMAWKMSTDLTRALVPSMGQHDPLDGLITCIQLESTATSQESAASGPDLKRAMKGFTEILKGMDFGTADPLGLGGLLSDAYRVEQLAGAEGAMFDGARWVDTLLGAAEHGLAIFVRRADWTMPPSHRLAFRELGLSIGFSAAAMLLQGETRDRAEAIAGYLPLGGEIISCWLNPENRLSKAWTDHRDINEVMLATSLCPQGFLVLR